MLFADEADRAKVGVQITEGFIFSPFSPSIALKEAQYFKQEDGKVTSKQK